MLIGCAIIWVIGNHLWYCWEDERFWPPLLSLHGVHFVLFLPLFGVWCDLVLMNACCYPSDTQQWVTAWCLPGQCLAMGDNGWQWASPMSLQPSCFSQNSVCQLSRVWTSWLSSLPGWERWSANICTTELVRSCRAASWHTKNLKKFCLCNS